MNQRGDTRTTKCDDKWSSKCTQIEKFLFKVGLNSNQCELSKLGFVDQMKIKSFLYVFR